MTPEVGSPGRPAATPYELLARLPDRGRPLVTHYAGPESRVELSVASMANAVAKAGGFLRDDLGLGPGSLFSIDLPRHWQLPVWVLAGLSVGATCGRWLPGHVAARIVGPDRLDAGSPGTGPCDELLVSSCDAFGMPVPGGVAGGAVDVALEVRAHPDVLVVDPRGAGAAVLDLAGEPRAWAAAMAAAVGTHPEAPRGARLWVDEATPEPEVVPIACLLPLALDGSVVIASGLTPEQADRVRAAEAVTGAR